MNEHYEQRVPEYRQAFESICQEFGSAKVVELLVACFGEEPTGYALEKLGVAGVMPGIQLVHVYGRNRNFEYIGEQS